MDRAALRGRAIYVQFALMQLKSETPVCCMPARRVIQTGQKWPVSNEKACGRDHQILGGEAEDRGRVSKYQQTYFCRESMFESGLFKKEKQKKSALYVAVGPKCKFFDLFEATNMFRVNEYKRVVGIFPRKICRLKSETSATGFTTPRFQTRLTPLQGRNP